MLELEPLMPFSARPSAPYRMDLAVTYRCNNDCAHCYNARERNFPELTTEQWFQIIDKLWELGIPHLVFTGGEASLRNDLPELIRQEDLLGDLHMHTTRSDGRQTIAEMAAAAKARGYGYVAITEHSKSLTMVGGFDEDRVRRSVDEIAAARREVPGIEILHGLEVDILADGSLDLDDDALELLDWVVVSLHSKLDQPPEEATRRVLKALEPRVGHEVVRDQLTLSAAMQGITARLGPGERITFIQLFEGQRTRGSVVITFLALLEMVKLRLLHIEQDEATRDIWVSSEAGALEGGTPEVDEREYS
jgi:hypothetical protein